MSSIWFVLIMIVYDFKRRLTSIKYHKNIYIQFIKIDILNVLKLCIRYANKQYNDL